MYLVSLLAYFFQTIMDFLVANFVVFNDFVKSVEIHIVFPLKRFYIFFVYTNSSSYFTEQVGWECV